MKNILILLLLSILSFESKGAIGKKISNLKDKLNVKINEIAKLGAEIKSIDKKIANSNDLYISKQDQLRSISEKLLSLDKQMNSLDLSKQKYSKILEASVDEILLIEADPFDTSKEIQINILKSVYGDNKKKLKSISKGIKQFENIITSYKTKVADLQGDTAEVYNLILELENKKKGIGEQYILLSDKKLKIESDLQNQQARRKVKKVVYGSSRIKIQFSKPLNKYVSIQKGSKGVTFKYRDVAPVFSTNAGRVVYSGELASYGKVVMIDHGNELRSVFLGDISPKVKKGDLVGNRDIIAYTNNNGVDAKSLYYEVRKKNKAQNTYALLVKNNKL